MEVAPVSRLEARRREAGLSQREFADAVGFTVSYVSKVENGRQRPSDEFIQRAVKALKPHLGDVIFGEPEVPAKGQPELCDARGASEMTGLSRPQIYALAARGDLPRYKLPNGTVRFRRSDVEAFIKERTRGRGVG